MKVHLLNDKVKKLGLEILDQHHTSIFVIQSDSLTASEIAYYSVGIAFKFNYLAVRKICSIFYIV